MKIVMPEDGWGERAVDFYCPVCEKTRTARSIYLNLDELLRSGMTQAEWFLALHMESHSLYGQCSMCEGYGWLWTDPPDDSDEEPERLGRCPYGCPDDETLDWYRAGLSG